MKTRRKCFQSKGVRWPCPYDLLHQNAKVFLAMLENEELAGFVQRVGGLPQRVTQIQNRNFFAFQGRPPKRHIGFVVEIDGEVLFDADHLIHR